MFSYASRVAQLVFLTVNRTTAVSLRGVRDLICLASDCQRRATFVGKGERRWEEGNYNDGQKWKFLEHKGPLFAPPYEPLPDNVHFNYDGKPMKLSPAAEEVATFFAKMLEHEYTSKEIFRNNFFTDWKKEMTKTERKQIKDLEKCDFKEIHKYFVDRTEEKKALPKEKKQELKAEADKVQQEFGFCLLDGHREKIGNFKVEPPGLFRGRGIHPKMGMLKKRLQPEDVIINCSKDSKIPEPPEGHRWKEVRHDNTVTWLASWTENVQGSIKYVMLNPSSKLKGEKDWQKFEMARKLKGLVDSIRLQYRSDWKAREMKQRQRGVALYFIDKLALRVGNEKDESETADTVGCCSLRLEHIKLHKKLGDDEYVVEFDFLGKDSIRYYNKVPVEKPVFKNLQLFMNNKNPEDDLFDRLTTDVVNKYLRELMDGLSAKVFRTFNASITLQQQLMQLTNPDDTVAEKILSYNRANRAVAILCNHQRAAPKSFEKSMENLQAKIEAKRQQLEQARIDLKKAKVDYEKKKDDKSKKVMEKKAALVKRLEEQLKKLQLQVTDREENKQIALGTSKLNYLDPRISVAWCKKFGVPIEKIYTKTHRDKFAWAIHMTDEDFEF
ncbi:DNA topoisomerase I, mitochondrial-like isoform X1 [Acipenser oxyrinchus oxyrinchus]|uniref:DNA topoisomerase I n=1 Tax=Acipenser oxyrinchus oxyrinchus TaxID=40147 RepID=A0AAD8LTT9_ACIOX|nr:DNA topoisomerase I, mitochondrial-like isoform X1 [Acipenser oxyrinchus oxyrinchus]